MGIYLAKGKRVGDLQDIYCKKYISATNIISKEGVKTHTSIYVPIAHYAYERIIMVTQLLRLV